uniref:Uncharacterized protein n=1 Tax=Ditylenchus dipsaci TaxID=166011 RepID=A0A915EQW0_9BILA
MQTSDGNFLYDVALATATMQCFSKKVGDFNSTTWLSSSSGVINKQRIVCAAFLNTFVHSELKTICSDIPALNYNEMKQCLCDQVNIMKTDEAAELPAKKKKHSLHVKSQV